jgi:hypothetical protein
MSAASKPIAADEATCPQSTTMVVQIVYDEIYDFGRKDRLGGRRHLSRSWCDRQTRHNP